MVPNPDIGLDCGDDTVLINLFRAAHRDQTGPRTTGSAALTSVVAVFVWSQVGRGGPTHLPVAWGPDPSGNGRPPDLRGLPLTRSAWMFATVLGAFVGFRRILTGT
ncbi:hypothetical protein GCM10009547_24600 [Sporichthya brevicatena]|uniref:Uncharacterized protein n=1 Tax=Sporichthya brevicatena TaxID=171442 RepID=A0ABN1GVM6_9ACTN